jgi:hypothetical protein
MIENDQKVKSALAANSAQPVYQIDPRNNPRAAGVIPHESTKSHWWHVAVRADTPMRQALTLDVNGNHQEFDIKIKSMISR